MTMNATDLSQAIDREYERLGLNKADVPYGLAGTLDGLMQYLEELRDRQRGTTWRDLYPEMPPHWVIGDPESWTEPFVPYGPWDYQQLPAGPSVMIGYRDTGAGKEFEALVSAAKLAGFELYGAGIARLRDSGEESNWGTLVLHRGASPDALHALVEWAATQPDVVVARPDRREEDVYPVADQ